MIKSISSLFLKCSFSYHLIQYHWPPAFKGPNYTLELKYLVPKILLLYCNFLTGLIIMILPYMGVTKPSGQKKFHEMFFLK